MNDNERRRIANNGALLTDAMNMIPGDVVQTHRRLGEAPVHTGEKRRKDGDGYWCESHERSLARCKDQELSCTGIPDTAHDPTGEAAVNEAGSELAAERRQQRHDDWLEEFRLLCDRGLREFGYGRAQYATHEEERLIDSTGCPIDCCPSCWQHTYKSGKHHEKSIEKDAEGGHHAAKSRDGRKVCGPCKLYEDDYGHLPPAEVLKMMHSTGRRPGPAHLIRLDPKLNGAMVNA